MVKWKATLYGPTWLQRRKLHDRALAILAMPPSQRMRPSENKRVIALHGNTNYFTVNFAVSHF